jgi:hypothetical protein
LLFGGACRFSDRRQVPLEAAHGSRLTMTILLYFAINMMM